MKIVRIRKKEFLIFRVMSLLVILQFPYDIRVLQVCRVTTGGEIAFVASLRTDIFVKAQTMILRLR